MLHLSYQILSDKHAATCFFNALWREWHDYTVHDATILMELSDTDCLRLPLQHFSRLGRHIYADAFYLQSENETREIAFDELLPLVMRKISQTFQLTEEQVNTFISDVLSSRNNMKEYLQVPIPYAIDFKTSEQALRIGHYFHPTPKSRGSMTRQDLYDYTPECQAEFPLQWLWVDKSILQQQSVHAWHDSEWLMELFQDEHALSVPSHMMPVPMHPWQWNVVQQHPTITNYLSSKHIIPVKEKTKLWSATSSLRTVYRESSPYMLKFSLSTRLTNSLRILLESEVSRGLLLHDVLATVKGKVFVQEYPSFQIITEPVGVGIKNAEGKVLDVTQVIGRINPFQGEKAKHHFMLASLTQMGVTDGRALLLHLLEKSDAPLTYSQRLKKWFADFLEITIKPLIMAYANYGIIMEAHQQNLVLQLEDGFIKKAYFRDCQDHGYSQLGANLYSQEVPEVTKYIADKVIGCHYFVYQVFLNTVVGVITTLATSRQVDESELLSKVYDFLLELYQKDLQDKDCLDMLLRHVTLLQKRNFSFALQRVNDNQVKYPLAFYTPVPNLMNQKISHHGTILYHRMVPSYHRTITLRPMCLREDLSLFTQWQKQEYVAKFWELDQSDEAITTYLDEVTSDPYHQAVIIEVNHVPVGYTELYWAKHDRIAPYIDVQEHDRGFHLLIGEKHVLGTDFTKEIFLSIMHYLYLAHRDTGRIVVEPNCENERFIKYMHKIPGWQFVKEAVLPEKRAAIFRHARSAFEWKVVV